MSNLKFDLLITQDLLEVEANSWIRFSSTNNRNLNENNLVLELSSNLVQHHYLQSNTEENSSNLPYYDAQLGFKIVKIPSYEYRLFIDSSTFNFYDEIPSLNIPIDNFCRIQLFDLELKNKNTGQVVEVPSISILLPLPITNQKSIYVVSDLDVDQFNLDINYYLEYSFTDKVRIEENYNSSNVQLTFINVPRSKSRDIRIELILNNKLVSLCSSNQYYKCIPANQFSTSSEQYSNLEDIAYAIPVLLDNNEKYLLYNIANGLRNKYEENNFNLPNILKRTTESNYDNSQNNKSYATLLLFLLQVNEKFPIYSNFLTIQYLQEKLSFSFSIASRNIIYGYDSDRKPYQFEDFSLLFLGYFALSHCQEYNYKESTEFTLSILREQIKFLYDTNFKDIGKYDLSTILEGIFWASLLAHYEKNEDYLSKISILFHYYVSTYQDHLFIDKIFYNLILVLYQEHSIALDYNPFDLSLINIGDGLYKTEQMTNLSTLKLSALVNILNSRSFLNINYNYRNYTTNSIYYKDLLELYIKKFIPIGLSWFSDKAFQPKVGILQAIIKACSYACITAIIQYYSSLNQLDLTKAQGNYLDQWGKLTNIFRSFGESDAKYRNRLIHWIQHRGDTLLALKQSLHKIDSSVQLNFNSQTGTLDITSNNFNESLVNIVSQLNYIGCKIRLITKSSYQINTLSGGIFYAGSNDYS